MQVFAHRGASAHAPENSLLAMEKAIEIGADGIELDVQQVADQLVVFHDRLLERNTPGSGRIQETPWHILKHLPLGQSQTIPTLWQVLTQVRGQCQLNLELKNNLDISLLNDTLNCAFEQLSFRPQDLLVSSFDHHLLQRFHALCPEVRIGALTASKPLDYAYFAERLQAYSVNIDMSVACPEFINDAHTRGLKVMVYTVDNAAELITLAKWGVDGVFSNDPQHAMQVLGKEKGDWFKPR